MFSAAIAGCEKESRTVRQGAMHFNVPLRFVEQVDS